MMLKKFIKIIVVIGLFLLSVTILDNLTTFKTVVHINEVTELDGIITINYDGTTGLGTNLKDIKIVAEDENKGIYKLEVLGSYLIRNQDLYNEYKIDNKDHRIKELRYYNPIEPSTYEIVFSMQE